MREVEGFSTAPQNDGSLRLRFEMLPRKNEEKSAAEGRPIFDEVEYIEIVIPGEKDNVHRPVQEKDRQRFSRQYADWKARGDKAGAAGTPLSAWPAISRAEVEELAYFNVRTVEELANVSDGNAQKYRGVQLLKQKAQDFLSAAAGEAPMTKLRSEVAERDTQIAELQRQMKEMKDLTERLEAQVKQKHQK